MFSLGVSYGGYSLNAPYTLKRFIAAWCKTIFKKSEIFVSLYNDYLNEIEERKKERLNPKPIDDGELLKEVISNIKDQGHEHRKQSLDFFIYNTIPGTTTAALEKAQFLKEIIKGDLTVEEINKTFAFELLSHMKGGPSTEVLLDLALGNDQELAKEAAEVLKTQVFLYDADTSRLKEAHANKNATATDLLESYARPTSLPSSQKLKRKFRLSPMLPQKVIFPPISSHLVTRPILAQTENFMVNVSFQKKLKMKLKNFRNNILTKESCLLPKKERWVLGLLECQEEQRRSLDR